MGGQPVPSVPTLAARILPGWMEREPAVNFLMNECVFNPPKVRDQAEEIWGTYHQRVQNLPERDCTAPQRLPLSQREQALANDFKRFHGNNQNIREVIKIDPMNLVAHQVQVILDQVARYAPDATSAETYAKQSLATARGVHNINFKHGLNAVDFSVPHGEFAFVLNQQTQQLQVLELARHVSVTAFQDRMLLWAGYHRSYARIANANPEAMDRSLLVALTTDADFFVSEQSPNQGLRAVLCGLRPPLFRDFFDPDFFMAVNLKRKRWVLQVRGQCVGVDDV